MKAIRNVLLGFSVAIMATPATALAVSAIGYQAHAIAILKSFTTVMGW